MFARFDEMKNLDCLSFQQSEPILKSIKHFDKEHLQDQVATSSNDAPAPIELTTRSIKQTPIDFQISFQTDFMKEHFASFKMQIQNYIEHVKKTVKEQTGSKLRTTDLEFYDLDNKVSVRDFLKTHSIKISQMEVNQFLKDLEFQDKLTEFLSFICSNCSSEVSSDLVLIAHEAWQNYIKIQEEEPGQEELMNIADHISSEIGEKKSKIAQVELINLRSAGYSQLSEIKKGYRQFLQYYCKTILLVIGQYFQNPAFSESALDKKEFDYPKRGFAQSFMDLAEEDEDQEDFVRKPQKKRKLSP